MPTGEKRKKHRQVVREAIKSGFVLTGGLWLSSELEVLWGLMLGPPLAPQVSCDNMLQL